MAYNSTFHKVKRDINIYQCCNKASYGDIARETHKQKLDSDQHAWMPHSILFNLSKCVFKLIFHDLSSSLKAI